MRLRRFSKAFWTFARYTTVQPVTYVNRSTEDLYIIFGIDSVTVELIRCETEGTPACIEG